MLPASSPNQPTPPPRRRILPRTRRGWLLAVVVTLLAFVLAVYLLVHMTPRWYAPLDPTSIHVMDLSDYVEKVRLRPDLFNTLERVPLGDQTWSISQTEINSFLAVHYAKQTGVAAPMVIFSPGKVSFVARISRIPGSDAAGGVGTISFTVQPIPGDFPAPPRLLIKLDGVWVGALRIPKFMVAGKLRALMPALLERLREDFQLGLGDTAKVQPAIENAAHAIENGEPFAPETFTFDRRKVMVKEVRVEEGRLTIVFAPPAPGVGLGRIAPAGP